VNSLLMLGGE